MNPPTTSFTPSNNALLLKFREQANELAAQASSWSDTLKEATGDTAAAKTQFLKTYSIQAAHDLAEAERQQNDFAVICVAVMDAGGPKQVREDALTTDQVFSAMEKAFSERAAAIEKLMPFARRKLGERQLTLTESGVPTALLGTDPIAAGWANHCAAITSALAVAKAGESYCAARGIAQSGGPRTWDSLYAILVSPLPQAPAVPVAKAA
jgi:hypothetical protein